MAAASLTIPSSIPSSLDLDSLIKVASQFDDLRDPLYPSCFKGWESNPDNIAFELISGHFLINTPFRVTDNLPPGECLQECKSDPDCKSLNIDYNRGTCEYLSSRLRSVVKSMRPSLGQNHYEKTCTPVKGSVNKLCPNRDWAFERLRNFTLIGFEGHKESKVLVDSADIVSRESCQFHCLNYTDFLCRSCEFNYKTKECFVSPFNRFSSNNADVGLKKTPDVDYFESNCIPGKLFLMIESSCYDFVPITNPFNHLPCRLITLFSNPFNRS